jgi:hypothetical protein
MKSRFDRGPKSRIASTNFSIARPVVALGVGFWRRLLQLGDARLKQDAYVRGAAGSAPPRTQLCVLKRKGANR